MACGVILTAVATFTCVRIETFNCRAGGFLPRADDDEGHSQWRVLAPNAARIAMEDAIRKTAEMEGKPFVLTPVQEADITEAMRKAQDGCDFRDFVESFGLAQYLVAPGALLLSVLVLRMRKAGKQFRLWGWSLASVCLGCIAMMFYRGYFSALAW